MARPEERSDETYMLCYMLKTGALFMRNTDVELDLSNGCELRGPAEHPTDLRPAEAGSAPASG